MALNTKIIKRRITSVQNTKKITRAMEMVSAAKMRKAVEAVLDTRLYGRLARELMQHLGGIDDPMIPLLEQRPVKKVLAVVISSNRGLCGAFNGNLFRQTKQLFDDKTNLGTYRNEKGKQEGAYHISEDFTIDIIAVGKKSVGFGKKFGYGVIAAFDTLGEKPSFQEIRPIADILVGGFIEKTYDKAVVAFTEYQSGLVQQPKIRQLLPVSARELEKMVAPFSAKQSSAMAEIFEDEAYPIENYLFEPDLETIMAEVLPRLVEIQLYQAILESSASEHSARMVAMKNASESAGEMIDELKLTYNKARQAGITQEIAEIAGGAAALE